jgi:hypothetical protein
MFDDDIGDKSVSLEFDATVLKQNHILGKLTHWANEAFSDKRYRYPRQETTPQIPGMFVDSRVLLSSLAMISAYLVNHSPPIFCTRRR